MPKPYAYITPDITLAGTDKLRSYSLLCSSGTGILKVAHLLNENLHWKLQASAKKANTDFFLYHYFQKWETTHIFLLDKQIEKTPDTNILLMFMGSVVTYPFERIISKIENLNFVFSITELEEKKFSELSEIFIYLKGLTK
jgi:hypothetical protein